jgi:hypothetical protein
MKHLQIWEKLLVAFAVVITANVFALVFMAADKNEPIATAAKERTGLTYLKPARQIRSLVSEIRRLPSAGAGTEALVEKKVAIDLAMTRLDELDLKFGWELGTTEDFVKLKKLWQQFKDSATGPDATAELEAKINNSLRSLHALVADTSGLVLDPALDSYYLMDASVVKLANEGELLNRLIDHTRRSFTNSSTVESNHAQLLAMLTLLKADIEAVKSDLDVATDFNPKLKLTLEEPRQQFERSAQQVLTLFERPSSGASRVDPKVLLGALEDALARTFKLYDTTVSLLDDLLKQRIEQRSSERNWALACVIAISLIGILSSLWIGHTTVTRLRKLTDSVRALIAGEQTGQLGTPSVDEIGVLTLALNDLAVSYRRADADRAASGRPGDRLSEENNRLKILITDLALENQALKAQRRAQSS